MIILKIIIENKEFELKDAEGFIGKLIGLAFKKDIDYVLRFRCNGIHTFCMREKIDVILTDKNNNVLYVYKNLKKNRIILPKKNVYYTYELPNNSIKDNKIKRIVIKDWLSF